MISFITRSGRRRRITGNSRRRGRVTVIAGRKVDTVVMADTSPGIGITDPITIPVASTGSIGSEAVTIGEVEAEADTGITTGMARGRAIIGIMITRGAVVIGKGTTTEDTIR